jgi:hypothetical protein
VVKENGIDLFNFKILACRIINLYKFDRDSHEDNYSIDLLPYNEIKEEDKLLRYFPTYILNFIISGFYSIKFVFSL